MHQLAVRLTVVAVVCGFTALAGRHFRKSKKEQEKQGIAKEDDGTAHIHNEEVSTEDSCNVVEKQVVYSPRPSEIVPSPCIPLPPSIPIEADFEEERCVETETTLCLSPSGDLHAELSPRSTTAVDELKEAQFCLNLDLSINETVSSVLFGPAINNSSSASSEWPPTFIVALPDARELDIWQDDIVDKQHEKCEPLEAEVSSPLSFRMHLKRLLVRGETKGEDVKGKGTVLVTDVASQRESINQECPAGPSGDADATFPLIVPNSAAEVWKPNVALVKDTTYSSAGKGSSPLAVDVEVNADIVKGLGGSSDAIVPLSHVEPAWSRDSVAELWGVDADVDADSALQEVAESAAAPQRGLDDLPDSCLSMILRKVAEDARERVVVPLWDGRVRVREANPLLRLAGVCRKWRIRVSALVQYIHLEGPQDGGVAPSGRGRSRRTTACERIWEWPEPGVQTAGRDLQAPRRTVGEALSKSLVRFPALVEVELRRCHVAGWHDLIISLGSHAKGLTTLIIAHAPALNGWENLGEAQLIALTEWCPNLETLAIEHTLSRTVKSLPSPLFMRLSHLTTFRLVGARSIYTIPSHIFTHPRLRQVQLALLPSVHALPDPPTTSHNISELRVESMKLLVSLPNSICFLNNLRKLAIIACPLLTTLPTLPPALEVLLVESCMSLASLPNPITVGHSQSLDSITLSDLPSLKELPKCLGTLTKLRRIRLLNCHGLNDHIEPLSSDRAEEVHAEGCRLRYLPKKLHQIPKLQILRWERCGLAFVPPSIGDLTQLRKLDLKGNPLVLSLPVTIGHLAHLERLNVDGCTGLRSLPDAVLKLQNLSVLSIRGCKLDQKVLRVLQDKGVRIKGPR